MATKKYVVMEAHRKIWRYLFMTEGMKSERVFWTILFCQALNMYSFFCSAIVVDGIVKKVEIVGPSLCWTGGMCTYVLAFFHRNAIFDTVSELQQHYERHKDNPKDRAIIMAAHKEGYRMFSIFRTSMVCCAVSFILRPFMIYVLQSFCGKKAEVELPFDATYPWEIKGFKFYVSFALQLSLMPWVIPMVIVDTSTSVFFCMAAVAYVQLAGERFKEIPEDCSQDEGVQLLKVALKNHQEALKMVKAIEMVESVKVFFQIFSTAAALSCLLLVSTKARDLSVIDPMAVLAICVILQLGLLCFYGQKVINEGDKLYEEINAVPWYNYSKQFKSLLVVCIMRAARSERLTAWGFTDVSMETFSRVLTTAFSYVTFLQTMSE